MIKAVSIAIFAVLIALAATPNAVAFNGNDAEKLEATNTCEQCDLAGILMHDANLSGAVMKGSNLTAASFDQANLTNADLREADLSGADFGEANLTNWVAIRRGDPTRDGWFALAVGYGCGRF